MEYSVQLNGQMICSPNSATGDSEKQVSL